MVLINSSNIFNNSTQIICQGFLSKTIDTPDIELPPLGDEDDDHSEEVDKSADTSPNNERRIK